MENRGRVRFLLGVMCDKNDEPDEVCSQNRSYELVLVINDVMDAPHESHREQWQR